MNRKLYSRDPAIMSRKLDLSQFRGDDSDEEGEVGTNLKV